MQTRIIFGPPGTGKTTTLMRTLESELAGGVSPRRIAYVSFTRRAISEAVRRASEVCDLGKEDMRYFKTLHALCYSVLGMAKDDIMQDEHYRELSELLGYEVTGTLDEEGFVTEGRAEGDRMLQYDSLARLRGVHVAEILGETDGMDSLAEVQLFIETMERYKKKRNLFDYTDMLERAAILAEPLDIDVAIVDEAQDLSHLQWRVVDKLMSRATRMYIAGDDDQSIYRWSGADVRGFLSRKGERVVLDQSYRVPEQIKHVADGIIARVDARNRVHKTWRPMRPGGVVSEHAYLDDLQLTKYSGTWLLLARNRYLLAPLLQYAKNQGVVFTTRAGSSVLPAHMEAIVSWEQLKAGRRVRKDHARAAFAWGREAVDKDILKGEGHVTKDDLPGIRWRPWEYVLTRIPQGARDYYMNLGPSISDKPRVHIDTIHGVKGAEADHVLIMPDMAHRTWKEYHAGGEDEHRVFYVACTRARKTLHLMYPSTDKYYEVMEG